MMFTLRSWRRALAFALLTVSLASTFSVIAAETEEAKSDWIYTIRPNDSLWALCRNYSKEPDCWLKLVKYNNLKTPKDIPPGTRIRIPQVWLKDTSASAEAIAVKGVVHKLEVQSQQRSPLQVGDVLTQNDEVRSQADSSATLQFADGSKLFLTSNTQIQLEGLSYNQADATSNTRVRLDRGRLRSLIEKQRTPSSSYEVATPAAVAAVRGTDFRVTLTDDTPAAMLTEVSEGSVAVNNGEQEVVLGAGYALRAVEGEAMSEPVAMLKRPSVSQNDQQTLLFPHTFRWQPLAGAVRYRVSIYLGDEQMQETMVESPSITLGELAAGQYSLWVRGIDKQGFEGRDRRFQLIIDER